MKTYSNNRISVSFDSEKCIHAGECVKGLPAVFDVDREPWIDVDGAAVEAIVEVVNQCPSGALSYRTTADPALSSDPAVSVEVREHGPYVLKGPVRIIDEGGTETVKTQSCALCRCGASRSKPYCDGSHKEVDF